MRRSTSRSEIERHNSRAQRQQGCMSAIRCCAPLCACLFLSSGCSGEVGEVPAPTNIAGGTGGSAGGSAVGGGSSAGGGSAGGGSSAGGAAGGESVSGSAGGAVALSGTLSSGACSGPSDAGPSLQPGVWTNITPTALIPRTDAGDADPKQLIAQGIALDPVDPSSLYFGNTPFTDSYGACSRPPIAAALGRRSAPLPTRFTSASTRTTTITCTSATACAARMKASG
jgi:hypothetical protein